MDPARYQRLRSIVHEASQRDAATRRAWLEGACHGDPALLAEATALLSDAPVDTRAVMPAELRRVAGPADLPAGATLGRYRIRGEIGRGGMGVVYEAEDVTTGRVVAVKVILPHLLALPSMRERFGREARLGAVVAHDNVVRTLDLGEARVGDHSLHYLVMERVHGRTLRRLLEELGTVPEALLREIAVQAARGLAALHAVGVVHRDVKPENILLADDRRVRIMDLGVAKVAGGSSGALTQEGQFIGSFRYASPEQCEGREIGPSADLYALGVVLYELAVGRAPFEGDDAVTLLRAHVEVRPAPVAERNPRVSDFLSDVIETLLEKRPERRFRTARDLETVLAEGEAGGWWRSRRRSRSSPRSRPADGPATPLIGRDAERKALFDAWRSARRSEGRVALVFGDAGIGKTRLLRELVDAVSGEDARILRSDVGPIGDSSALREPVLAALPTGEPEAELGRRLDLPAPLATAFLAFLRGRPAPEGVERLAPGVAEGLLARLALSFADDAPLLWVVDDVHFADAETRRALLYVARALAGRRALLVVSAQPTVDAAFAAALGLLPSFARIDVERLSDDEIVRLSTQLVGGTTIGARLGRTLAPRVDGVPFYLVEMVRELERRGHLVRDASGALREGAALATFDVPSALRDLLRSRLSGLSLEERAVLDAAAVEGYEFDPAVVARVRGLARLDTLEILGRLERRDGLVHSAARKARFESHLLHEVVYEDLPAALRSETHARIADALEQSPPPGATPGELAALVAPHRIRGPEPERALASVTEAVAELERAGRPEAAVDLARRALALDATKGQARVALLSKLTDALTTLGRPDEVKAALEEAKTIAAAEGLASSTLHLLVLDARRLFVAGEFEACLTTTERALEAGGAAPWPGRANALSWRGQSLWCLGRHAEARACHEQALAEAVAAGNAIDEMSACTNLAAVLNELGLLPEAEARLRRAHGLSKAAGRRPSDAAVLNLGNVLADQGRAADALACYEDSRAYCRTVGARDGEAVAHVNIGAVRLRVGDFEGAEEALQRCVDICREIGSRRVLGYGLAALAELDYLRGDLPKARRLFDEALALRRALDNRHATASTLFSLALLDLAEDRFEDARARLDEAETLAKSVGDPNIAALVAIHRARLPGGDLDAARRAFDEARPRLRRGPLVEALAHLWRLGRDRRDLVAALELVEADRRNAPEAFRAAMVERIPDVRTIVEDAARLGIVAAPGSAA